MANKSDIFQACEKGDIVAATNLLRQLDLTLEELTANLRDSGLINMIKRAEVKGDNASHLAGRSYRLELMSQLLHLDAYLCDCPNRGGEDPLKLAISLGLRETVDFLITSTSNALHYIVELNQVKLVRYLIKGKRDLSERINEPYQPDGEDKPPESAATNKNKPEEKEATNSTETDMQDDQPIVLQGDTPLHVAARNKYDHMVNLLLNVPGLKKFARNSENKTPFEIAREVTEYHESFRIIRKLGDFRWRLKPFMYCVPQVSHKKYKNARSMVKTTYEERRNSELVVAALLASMTCAAAFTVPGGFNSESSVKENGGSPAPSPSNVEDDLGTPLLISLVSFKLFIIFDCIAFFLALFVCIMWEMSCELTTGDKMLFMTFNSLLVCSSFGFTAYGFMAAVYAMLAGKVETFSWVVLGSLIFITLCGVLAFIQQSVRFSVTRARFHRLCGVSCIFDDFVEKVWCGAECCGLLDIVRSTDDVSRDIITAQVTSSNSSLSSPLCCFNHV